MKARIILRSIFVMASLLIFIGCGAMLHGTKQTINVSSTPPGVSVKVSPGEKNITTPAKLVLSRKYSYTLVFEMEGYTSETIYVNREIEPGILVMDIFWFPIGVIIDGATGAWYRLSPDNVTVTMKKESGASKELPENIHITVSTSKVSKGAKQLEINSSVPGVRVLLCRKTKNKTL